MDDTETRIREELAGCTEQEIKDYLSRCPNKTFADHTVDDLEYSVLRSTFLPQSIRDAAKIVFEQKKAELRKARLKSIRDAAQRNRERLVENDYPYELYFPSEAEDYHDREDDAFYDASSDQYVYRNKGGWRWYWGKYSNLAGQTTLRGGRYYSDGDLQRAKQRAVINALLVRFISAFKSALRYGRDKRILGILLFIKVLGYNKVENNYINCQGTQIVIHAQPGTYRASLAETLYYRITVEIS